MRYKVAPVQAYGTHQLTRPSPLSLLWEEIYPYLSHPKVYGMS